MKIFASNQNATIKEYLKMMDEKINKREAKRNPTQYRYDILDPEFLATMARIGAYGAEKYGDWNWQKSRLDGDKGPINHIYKHLTSYRLNEPYDHPEIGLDRKTHLAAIAFNAMMEFWYECQAPAKCQTETKE